MPNIIPLPAGTIRSERPAVVAGRMPLIPPKGCSKRMIIHTFNHTLTYGTLSARFWEVMTQNKLLGTLSIKFLVYPATWFGRNDPDFVLKVYRK